MPIASPLLFTLVLVLRWAWPGSSAAADFVPTNGLRVVEVARGIDQPVYLTSPAGDPRLFVVEQPGRIRIFANGRMLAEPFLDIAERVGFGGERGLLSVAFPADYARTGLFYVNYTDRHGDTRVERYATTHDANRADPASAKLVIGIAQPYSNHNGGQLQFGPDGCLYIGMGDGGSGGDPQGNGQNRQALLAKLLRIRVDRGEPYSIPARNPFLGVAGARPEVWATGLRNPWRFSFDRVTRRIYIADVGQNRWEEIDVAPDTAAGLNYGWNVLEANHDFRVEGRPRAGLTPAVVEYGHDEGCSVTGGYVYRGRAIPAVTGHYFFSDYCRGWLRSFRYENGRALDRRQWNVGNLGAVTSFGEDAAGELYVMNQEGRLFKLAAAP